MKSILKKTAIILSFLSISAVSFAQKADLSGRWKRNDVQTDPGHLSINSVPRELIIEQKNNSINIQRTSVNGQGEVNTYTEKLNFDGSMASVVVKTNLKKTSKAQWSTDQNALSITADYFDDQGNKVQNIHENYMLTNGNKTLIILRTDLADGQSFELKEVFDKQ